MKHMPRLDGLRAVAVFAVLVAHFSAIGEYVPGGFLGVRLFFVLSGFLITSILLECRSLVRDDRGPAGSVIRTFYIRRFLRIFPIFYVTLMVAIAFDVGNIRSVAGWHFFYLSNFAEALYEFVPGGVKLIDPTSAHFWSLAVEEQFYLLWPAAVIFTPRRYLVSTIVGMILLAPIFRAATFAAGAPILVCHLPCCLDTLGCGALLAVHRSNRFEVPGWIVRAVRPLAWAAAIVLAVSVPGYWLDIAYRPRMVVVDFAAAILSTVLVNQAAGHAPGWLGAFLGWKPVRYLGRISYGIYVYHAFMAPLQLTLWKWLALPPLEPDGAARFLVLTTMTVAIAALSWHVLEASLNGLKRYFPYAARPGREKVSRGSVQTSSRPAGCGAPSQAGMVLAVGITGDPEVEVAGDIGR